jgi:hypothetical protein
MDSRLLVGTEDGLWEVTGDSAEPVAPFAGRSVTALARAGERTWAIVEGRTIWTTGDRDWQEEVSIDGPLATCLAPTPAGLLVGTEQAHLVRVNGAVEPVEPFETVEGRDAWYTPWGDPADVRSISVAVDGTIHVNVHVGGVVRSRDGGRSWSPTVDIEADVHQVLAHPTRPDVVLVAAFDGLGVSRNGGDAWEFITSGLPAHYSRAVAVSNETVLISASTGPRGRRAAIYRRPLDSRSDFRPCRDGLPAWFDDNIDTGCLAAAGPVVVFGTEDGRVFRSVDGGERWHLLVKGLPPVGCVTVG